MHIYHYIYIYIYIKEHELLCHFIINLILEICVPIEMHAAINVPSPAK